MRTVLIVEDDVHVRSLVAVVLTKANYRVLVAEDVGEVIQTAALGAPDVILLDGDAGGSGFGFDLLLALRRNPSTQDAAVVLMTGMVGADAPAGIEPDGATSRLEKPFSRRELLDAIAAACESSVAAGEAPPIHLYSV